MSHAIPTQAALHSALAALHVEYANTISLPVGTLGREDALRKLTVEIKQLRTMLGQA